MRSIFKRITAILMCVLFVSALFAEPASTGVTDSDVKNWAKNLNSIVKELQTAGVWSGDSINATAKQKTTVDGILNKYGISGSNCIDKFGMITTCAIVVVAASELDAQSAALLKAMGMDPMAELKKNCNSKDYAVVEANSKAVAKAYQNLDTSSIDYDTASNAAADYAYGNDDLTDLYTRLGNAFAQVAAESESGSRNTSNENTESIKKLYDQMNNAKGDSGVIYKSKKNGSKYKKTTPKKGRNIAIQYGDDGNEINWTFNLDAKKAKLDFTWGGKTKTINYTISSVEYYYLTTDSGLGGEGNEYIISTKEGPVFHFFDEWDYSGNAFQKQIGIKGISFESLFDADAIMWFYSE
ncbi:MAG: hypothetical protein IKX70_05440 [Treponema sp.]|nr:hypothetical protein [Treponema sp.]MBR5033092.1 hypothetical protein [Treponema sp.]